MNLRQMLEEFTFNCQCRRLSPKTTANYKKQIEYLLNFLEQKHNITMLDGVQPQHIKQFLMEMQKKGRKPAYINDLLKAFKCFFKYLKEEEYTDKLLTEKVKNVKQPKVIIKTFSNDEVQRLINCYEGMDYLSIRNKTMIAMFFDTGCRLNEVITMTNEQIHANYFLIHGKGDKERVVNKSPYIGKLLFKYQQVKTGYFEYKAVPYKNVFLSKNGKPLTSEAVEKVIRVAGERAGIETDIRISPHTFRHTFAQMQLKNGLDLYSLSRLMGHESIAITQRYLEGIRDNEVLTAGLKTSPLMNL